MASEAPNPMGERSVSRTVTPSVRAQPLNSYRRPSVRGIVPERTATSGDAPPASSLSDLRTRVTVESGVAVP